MAVSIYSQSASISASGTTARTAYPTTPSVSPLNGVLVINSGTTMAFVNSGDSTVTATTSNQPVHPNWPRVFLRKPDDTHMAAILASGTGTVYFVPVSADEQV